MTNEEILAQIAEQFDPINIVRLIRRCDDIADAVSLLELYGNYRAINARSEGLSDGLDSAMDAVDKALKRVVEPFPSQSWHGG